VRKITTARKKLTTPKKDTSPTKASTTTLKSQLPNNKSLPPKTKHQICHKTEGDSATESPTTRQRKTITATYVAANISEAKNQNLTDSTWQPLTQKHYHTARSMTSHLFKAK